MPELGQSGSVGAAGEQSPAATRLDFTGSENPRIGSSSLYLSTDQSDEIKVFRF